MASVKRILLRMAGSKFDALLFHVIIFLKKKRNETQPFLKQKV